MKTTSRREHRTSRRVGSTRSKLLGLRILMAASRGGGTYEYTFDTEGTFDYFCIPHESAGMTGTVSVKQGGGAEGGGGGESVPQVPNSAKTLGVATTGAMVLTLGLAYFFMKYGGDYGEFEE